MTIAKARKILKDNGINYSNYTDIAFVEKHINACLTQIKEACQVVMRFILTGK